MTTEARCSLHDVALTDTGVCEQCTRMFPSRPSVTVLQDGDDDGYRAWLAKHRGGYVINIQRSFNPSDARLHQAECSTINGQPARGDVFVGDYIKVCALRRADLDRWATEQTGAPIKTCELCF